MNNFLKKQEKLKAEIKKAWDKYWKIYHDKNSPINIAEKKANKLTKQLEEITPNFPWKENYQEFVRVPHGFLYYVNVKMTEDKFLGALYTADKKLITISNEYDSLVEAQLAAEKLDVEELKKTI